MNRFTEDEVRPFLLKVLNDKHIEILRRVAETSNRSLTWILHRISEEKGIPLSTLKFNSKSLLEWGLIERVGWNGKKMVRLTGLGYKVVKVVGLECEVDRTEKEAMDGINSVNHILRDLLRMVNGFHSFSSITSLNIIYSIFETRKLLGRDIWDTRIVLSKGHAAPALYAVLKHYGLLRDIDFKGAFTSKSFIQTHPVKGCPLVMVSTGSLGQGLSIANGLAIALKSEGIMDDVYVIMGDGELDEGMFWEALSTASSHKLDNIILLIDRNFHQLTGYTEDIKVKESIEERLRSFGWLVDRIPNNVKKIISSLSKFSEICGTPKALIVDTWPS